MKLILLILKHELKLLHLVICKKKFFKCTIKQFCGFILVGSNFWPTVYKRDIRKE